MPQLTERKKLIRRHQTAKIVDWAADLSERMKKALVRTADQVQNLANDGQVTSYEYASDKLQYNMEDTTTEIEYI